MLQPPLILHFSSQNFPNWKTGQESCCQWAFARAVFSARSVLSSHLTCRLIIVRAYVILSWALSFYFGVYLVAIYVCCSIFIFIVPRSWIKWVNKWINCNWGLLARLAICSLIMISRFLSPVHWLFSESSITYYLGISDENLSQASLYIFTELGYEEERLFE